MKLNNSTGLVSTSMASSYSTPASLSSSWSYDVFLSFRGEDTRKTFVDHLYSALNQRLIRTYKDDETLPRGEHIGPSLLKAIEESKIIVIVFSKNYADSSWCLEELAHIMKCKDERELIVMPIFYDVDPSDVRKQKRKFGEAFAKHGWEPRIITKTKSWRKALVDASYIAGWEPKNIANGNESTVIKRIVDTISDRLISLNSEVDEDLVGITSRLKDLKTRLGIGSGGVRMVGIWGVGGSGKTTLGTSLHMEISHHFEGHYIVENIREESHKYGLKRLQEKLLSAIFKTEVKVQGVADGKSKLKRALCHSNVLVLLDDVDDAAQLEALAGSHNWFGRGSRIIITTRDEHLLTTHKVDHIFPIALLSHDEAIMLFNKHAYNKNCPIYDYETLSSYVVSYAARLPLALKVLGSFLYDKSKKEWMSFLARLKDIPEMEIVEKLKISYDGLKTVEKELFLDIACFFRGHCTDDAMEIFEACGYHPCIGIKVLRQKALITIVNGKFDMHDLVQEMGHYIVRAEHPNNPEKHRRVWKPKEIIDMCFWDATMENDKIEAIKYRVHDSYYKDEGDGEDSRLHKFVSNMKKLRWICLSMSINNGKHVEGPSFLSNELRYIYFEHYPASPFPNSFRPVKLVVLKLCYSFQKQLWKGYKILPHLEVLELKYLDELLITPDFDGLPCLQKLTLFNCRKLEEIHTSLGSHRSVKYINVSCCSKLKKFPRIVHMKKLETLEIEYCNAILECPEIQANMESLVNLSLIWNGIGVLPASIGVHCTSLLSLHLVGCSSYKSIEFNFYALKCLRELKFGGYTEFKKMPLLVFKTVLIEVTRNLQKLDLSGCHLKDGETPSEIGEFSNLEELDLSSNDFSRIDYSLLQLTRLKLLNLNDCKQLVELPKLPSSITILKADNCHKIKTLGDFHKNCKRLCQVSIINGKIITLGDRLLDSMLKENAIKDRSMVLRLQGLDIAKGFTPPLLLRGSRYNLKLPENWYNNFCGFLMCAAVYGDFHFFPPRMSMKKVMSDMDSKDDVVWDESDTDDTYTCVWYVSFDSLRHTTWLNSTCKAALFTLDALSWEVGVCSLCRAFGVRLVERKTGSGPMETTQEECDLSSYTPNFKILPDSQYGLLNIWFTSTVDY